MAVAIEQQRQGTGTLLLKTLEDQAAELGAVRIMLDAREQALGFYRKRG